MSHAPDRQPGEPAPNGTGRYVALQMNDEQVVVYDAEVETAWVQSDTTVEMDAMT